jgi:hypothetical protein
VHFALYLDESGKTDKGEFTSLCGYVGTIEEWSRFNTDWDNLRFKWQVPPIHMSRVMYPANKEDEWKRKWESIPNDIWDDWRHKMLDEFAQLIQLGNSLCVGSVVDAVTYRTLKATTDDFVLSNEDSNVFALHNAIMSALDKIEVVDKNPSVSVILDDDQGTALQYYESLRNLRSLIDDPRTPADLMPRFERIKRCVHGIAFCNDAYFPPLQAADMISYVARRFKVEQKIGQDVEPSAMYALLTRGGLSQPQYYPAAILEKLARNVAAKNRQEAQDDGATKLRPSDEEDTKRLESGIAETTGSGETSQS